MSTQRTKEETEEELRRKTRAMPGKFAGNLISDPDFQQILNRYMISQHLLWGTSLAVTFIGINYTMIWLTEAYHIFPWQIAVILTPIGAAYNIWQFWKYRQTPKNKTTNN